MPIYEYQCEQCGQVSEHWQKISDPPMDTCEACGGPLGKLISRSAFHLKGGGWYVTDYAGKKQGGDSSEKKSSESKAKKSDSGSSAKADS